jgi:replicative DNA helicase
MNNLKQPHSEEAEDKLIASCLLDGDTGVYDTVSRTVSHEDFYTLRGKLFFHALGELASAGEPINEVSIAERLKMLGGLDEVGGMAGIYAVMDKALTSTQAEYYAGIVDEKSRLRSLIRSCRVAMDESQLETMNYDHIRSTLEAEIIAKPSRLHDKSSISNSAKEIMSEIKAMQDGTYEADVVKTHLGLLDDQLGNGGIAAGEVLTLAAPTSCGKSALALYIASQSVVKDGHACGIFSLEMPQKQLTNRLLQTISGVNMRNIREGTATDDQVNRVNQSINDLDTKYPIVTSHSVRSADDLVSQTRQFVRNKGVKLVIIDYLQLIPFNSNKMSKNEGIADISHKVKQMALDLNIAVILLAQVNREGAKRGPLELYDLKDSGDIENDADVVLLMYPSKGSVEDSKDQDHKGSFTSLNYKLAKNREGERGIGSFFKFYHCVGRFE